MNAKQFIVKDGLLPGNWEINNRGIAPYTAGRLELLPITLPDGTAGHAIHWELPENRWDLFDLICRQQIKAETLHTAPHYGGFWARGNGTLTMRFKEHSGTGSSVLTENAFLISPGWRFYRTAKAVIPKQKTGSWVTVQFQLYGEAEIAMPEIAPLPAVDRSAELTFYVPFDHGNPAARFSRGNVEALGYGEIMPGVQGVDGQPDGAMRFDRKRHFTPAGFLRFQMGLNYEGMRSVLDPDTGTLELWMRPLPEMAVFQKWEPFPIFNCGKHMSAWSKHTAPLELFIRRAADKSLELVLAESNLTKEWPAHTRKATDSTRREYVHNLGDARQFVGKWHHIALTYDANGRAVFLNGKKVIAAPAMKKPALYYHNTLQLAAGHIAGPSVISSDVDEFRIYRGVRYHCDFSPVRTALSFQPVAEEHAGSFAQTEIQVGKPSLNQEKNAFIFPVSRGTERYELRLSLGNGYPLLFSSKDAAMGILVPEHPAIPDLMVEKPQFSAEKVSGEITRRGTSYSWEVKKQGNGLAVTLNLDKQSGDWKAFVECRAALRNIGEKRWTHHFDGCGIRDILMPFRPFAFDEMILALPLSGAWNGSSGMCIALTPETIVSYVSRGMKSADTLELAVRSVLDNGDRMTIAFAVFPFSGKYGERALTDAYHARHPETFARSREVDPRLYGGASTFTPWQTQAYQTRKNEYSHQEINRRAGCSWHWLYKSGTSTGNWAPEMEILSELSMLNRYEVANADYHRTSNQRKVWSYEESSRKSGINQAPYISQWLEKRFVPYFRDSVFDDYETTSSGVEYINGFYWPPITDYIGLQSGTDFGRWLRRQLRGMLENFHGVNAFSHDELVGDYYFRKGTDLGGIRAFDENGAYVHNLAAMGKFCADITAMPNTTPYRTAIIGNARIQNSGFPAIFRMDNIIYERTMHQAQQDWTTLRLHTRMMGEKPDSFWIEGFTPIIGNYFHLEKDDLRLTKYLFTRYNQQQILLGMLFNVNMHFGVLGVKEAAENIRELRRVQDLGYRQVSAVTTAPDVLNARYGEAALGVLALVNPSFEERPGYGTADAEYLNAVPLLAENGRTLEVNLCSFRGKIQPHSWRLIEMTAAVKGTEALNYISTLKTALDGRNLQFRFRQPAFIPELVMGLLPQENLISAALNNQKLAFRIENGKAVFENLKLAAGDVLSFQTSDRRWLSSAEKIADMPYLQGRKLAIVGKGKNAEYEAERLQEYFRFWTARQPAGQEFKAPVFKDFPADARTYPVIVLFEDGPEGISLNGNVIMVRAKGHKLAELTDEFFRALDSRYKYLGVFGDQMPTKPWDFTTTREQRELQQKCGVIKRLISVDEDVKGFRDWLRDSRTDLSQGF